MTPEYRILKEHVARLKWAFPVILASLGVLSLLSIAAQQRSSRTQTLHSVSPVLIVLYLCAVSLSYVTIRHIGQLADRAGARLTDHAAGTNNHETSFIQKAPDAILCMDSQYRITVWNHEAESLFGYEADEIVGLPCSVLLRPGPSADRELKWLVQTVRRDGRINGHETTFRHRHGEAIEIDLSASRLSDDPNHVEGLAFILHDITHRKRLDGETARFNTRLYKKTADQTRELTHKMNQLARANLEMQQLDQTRTEFVSLVSHQIRAPLTNMAGAVQHMQADCRDVNHTCRRMFRVFEQQVARLDRLVQDVLNATRIEAGEMRFHFEPVSVLPIIHQVVDQLQTQTPARPIHIVDKPGMPLAYADRDRIADIITNLLDNADKYSAVEKDVTIEVRANETDTTVSVRDRGPGIPADDLERIFEKFYRTDSSDAQAAYGYGLGLYVCRRLIDAHKGQIWAENHPEGGAVFSFSLPIWSGYDEPENSPVNR